MKSKVLVYLKTLLIWIAVSGCSERLDPGMTGYRNSSGKLVEIEPSQIQVSLPLYDEFIQAETKVVENHHALKGYNYLGTDFEADPARWENGGYWCTPINSVAFGWTGGDGVHYSFLLEGDTIDEHSPVIMTVPMHSDLPNIIVAENFADFLKLGLNHGFFSLEHLSYQPETFFPILITRSTNEKDQTDFESSIGTTRKHRLGLDYTRELLQLGPCNLSKNAYEKLQQKYLPKLILPETE